MCQQPLNFFELIYSQKYIPPKTDDMIHINAISILFFTKTKV